LPHWPACKWTISRILRGRMEVNFQQTERAPVIPHRARDANVLDVGRNDAPF